MDWAFPSSPDSSAPQPEEEGVLALLTVQGVILVIKIQNVLLGLKSKLLVEQHSRVACRDVKGDVLAHAGLPREAGGKKRRYYCKRTRQPLGECGGEEIHQLRDPRYWGNVRKVTGPDTGVTTHSNSKGSAAAAPPSLCFWETWIL